MGGGGWDRQLSLCPLRWVRWPRMDVVARSLASPCCAIACFIGHIA
jgi:hypothetical protein